MISPCKIVCVIACNLKMALVDPTYGKVKGRGRERWVQELAKTLLRIDLFFFSIYLDISQTKG
jgi:hypothetical protein